MKEQNPHIHQIRRIEQASKKLLRQGPDCDELDMRFYTPYGPDHAVDLLARNSTHPIASDKRPRRAALAIPNPGWNIVALSTDIDKTTPEKFSGFFNTAGLSEVPVQPEDVDESVVTFVQDLVRFPDPKFRTPSLIDTVTDEFWGLVIQGDSDHRKWIIHKPEDGPEVIIMTREIGNPQPWSKNATEPQLHVRVKAPEGRTDFTVTRDGDHETSSTIRSEVHEAVSVYGEENVLLQGGQPVVIDLGGNKAKKDVVTEVERMFGLYEVRKENLDTVEQGLEAVLKARKIQ